MAQLVVLLEKDFKNTLKKRPRTYISNNINLPYILKNSFKTEYKLIQNNINENLNNDGDVVEILPCDIIDIGSGSDDGSDPVTIPGQFFSTGTKINKSNSSNKLKHKQVNSIEENKVKKIKKEKSVSEEDPFEDKSDDGFDMEVLDKSKLKRRTNDKKKRQNKANGNKMDKSITDGKIKLENDIDLDEDPFDSNSQNDDNDISYSEEDTEGSQNNNLVARKRKSVNNPRKNKRRSKISQASGSDSEYVPKEFGSSGDDASDWETERASPSKKYRKQSKQYSDPVKRIRKKLLKKVVYYICTICSKGVRTAEEKEAHRKSHNLRYLSYRTFFRCPECNFDIGHFVQFRLHFQKHHSKTDNLFDWKTCTECAYKTTSNMHLKQHLAHHKEKGTFQCTDCSFSHNHKKNLTRHLRLHNKFLTGIYSCEDCSYMTKHDSNLYKHKNTHHTPEEQKKWTYCNECPFKTIEHTNLRKHVNCHQSNDGYQCPHCTYKSPSACRVTDHIKVHFGKNEPIPDYDPKRQTPLYQCPKCSYKTMSKAHLDRHTTTHQTYHDRRVSCAECPFTCKDKIDLKTHVNYHNDEGALKCPWCSFSHYSKPTMTRHKRLHSDDRENNEKKKNRRKGEPRCPICNVLFQAPSFVKRHMKKHQTIDQMENPFMCALCPYRSKTKDKSLINHIQCHFKTDGMKCDFCSFRHDRLNVMTAHKKLHKEAAIKMEQE